MAHDRVNPFQAEKLPTTTKILCTCVCVIMKYEPTQLNPHAYNNRSIYFFFLEYRGDRAGWSLQYTLNLTGSRNSIQTAL